MSQLVATRQSVSKLSGELQSELSFPAVASAFRDFVQRVQELSVDPTADAVSARDVRVLRAGATFGNLLQVTSRMELLKLAEAGQEDARTALRELVGTCAVYPGTFDPFTVGHGDVVRRAARLFDRVVVAIGVNPAKSPLFSVEERMALIREDLKDLGDRVEVVSFDKSLVSLAKRFNCNVVLKGIRTVTDYEYELQLAQVNSVLSHGEVETLFIPAKEGASFVSSSMVKAVIKVDEDASTMVSPPVLAALIEKHKEGRL